MILITTVALWLMCCPNTAELNGLCSNSFVSISYTFVSKDFLKDDERCHNFKEEILECSNISNLVVLAFDETDQLYVNAVTVNKLHELSDKETPTISASERAIRDNLGEGVKAIEWKATLKYKDVESGKEVILHLFRAQLPGISRQYAVLPDVYVVEPVRAKGEVIYSGCKRRSEIELIEVK